MTEKNIYGNTPVRSDCSLYFSTIYSARCNRGQRSRSGRNISAPRTALMKPPQQFSTADSGLRTATAIQHHGQRRRCCWFPRSTAVRRGGDEAGFPSELDGAPLSLSIFAHYHLHQRISMRGLSPITSHENPWPSGFSLCLKLYYPANLEDFKHKIPSFSNSGLHLILFHF